MNKKLKHQQADWAARKYGDQLLGKIDTIGGELDGWLIN